MSKYGRKMGAVGPGVLSKPFLSRLKTYIMSFMVSMILRINIGQKTLPWTDSASKKPITEEIKAEFSKKNLYAEWFKKPNFILAFQK